MAMKWSGFLVGILATSMIGVNVLAQDPPPLPPHSPIVPPTAPVGGVREIDQPVAGASGLEPESLPRELAEDIDQPSTPKFGPTAVSDVRFLMDRLHLKDVFGESRIR